jgi:hypothetical protein
MEHAKIAYAAGALAVSLLGGVALGGYTVGGLQLRQPIDIIAQAAVRSQPDEPDEMPIAQVERACLHRVRRQAVPRRCLVSIGGRL